MRDHRWALAPLVSDHLRLIVYYNFSPNVLEGDDEFLLTMVKLNVHSPMPIKTGKANNSFRKKSVLTDSIEAAPDQDYSV